ncbi:type I restriction-modification system subunit M [Gelidibacter gilvus]|uniref:site-specific DNA-methyltransferase (adenine-specific) n=1 Tax=Gelidibacter gilvus TaxID=59602 RepID=A0A4Q0XHP1_9FLAO|nr:class I SAM-dependent DNA methyltransferase [Gelidibacter gilvus]RXJ51088.1 SAM-dependent DNA methyltransferase [Gelidibacter gilvus]
MITGELKSQIDQIWNTFWTGGISNTITIVEQLTYLIFIKDLDETETRNERMSKRLDKEFTPIFGADQQDFRWKNLKEMDVNERHSIFSNTVDGIFPFIRSLGSEKSLFSTYMKGATFGISKPAVLDQVMEKLERLDMSNQDIKGDIYEYLLSKLEGGGTAGQFRTPRHIIKMMVHMMQPTLEDTISDPAAGTAGFLVAAKEYIDKHYDVTELDKHREHINKHMFSGSEFDATMLRIASMNLFLHGVEEPKIIDVDAVSKDNSISDAYTLILANPPFKGTIDKESIAPGLRNVTDTTKTELLFLALMLRQLKKGGRAAVVVPDGVLFGSGKAHKNIREEIVANHKLEAVISLPSGIFKPYSGVSTAIIIFTKTDNGGTDNVWFYDMLADGKSLDDKRNLLVDADIFEAFSFGDVDVSLSAVEDLKNLHDKFNLPDVIKRFASLRDTKQSPEVKRKRTEQSFLVPFKEIKANDWDLSINRYKEIVYEEVEYDAPLDILKKIEKLNSEKMSINDKLSKLL